MHSPPYPYTILLITIDLGIPAISFLALATFIVILATLWALIRRSKDWIEAIRLHIGLGLLSLYLLTHWIDLVISHTATTLSPYTQIYTLLTHLLLTTSTILTLTGTWHCIIRYDFLRPLRVDLRAEFKFSFILWSLGIIQMVLEITATGMWLAETGDGTGDGGTMGTVERVSRARSVFEVALCAVGFCASGVMCVYACSRATERVVGCAYYREMAYMSHFTFALLLRSFTEIITTGQLNRVHTSIRNTERGRDVMFYLLSIYLCWVVCFAIPQKGTEDPLVLKDQQAVEEIKTAIEAKIAAVTDGGKNTAPTMKSVLDEIESGLKAQKVEEGEKQMYFMKLAEIGRLRQWETWEPVTKGDGGRGDVVELVGRNDERLKPREEDEREVGRMSLVGRLWKGKEKEKKVESREMERVEVVAGSGVGDGGV